MTYNTLATFFLSGLRGRSLALAAGILAGLLLNAWFGWWWADIGAGVIIVAYGIREGAHHLRAADTSIVSGAVVDR